MIDAQLSSSCNVPVRFTTLKDVPQAVASLLQNIVKLVYSLRSTGDSSGVQIRYDFDAEVRSAANAFGGQHRGNFVVVSSLHLMLSQLLNNDGYRANIVHSIAKFV